MSCYCPTLQWLCLLSLWIGQQRPQPILWKTPIAGFGRAMVNSLGRASKRRHIQKKEKKWCLGLRWPKLYGCLQGGVWEKGYSWGIEHGRVSPLCLEGTIQIINNNNNKIRYAGLKRHLTNKSTCNNHNQERHSPMRVVERQSATRGALGGWPALTFQSHMWHQLCTGIKHRFMPAAIHDFSCICKIWANNWDDSSLMMAQHA